MADDQRAALYRATVQKQGATRFDIQRTAERDMPPPQGWEIQVPLFSECQIERLQTRLLRACRIGLNFQYRARVI